MRLIAIPQNTAPFLRRYHLLKCVVAYALSTERGANRLIPAISLFILLVLGGCTFTYTPPVREARAPEPRFVVGEGTLVQTEEMLELELQVSVPESDWLAVQWFSPANDEVSATSLWLGPTPEPQRLRVALPSRIDLTDGLWRVVLSYQGRLVRQFSATVRVP